MFVSNVLYSIISSSKSWDWKKRSATSDKLISNVLLPNFISIFLAKERELHRGESRNFRKGWPGLLPTCQLYRYFWFFWEFYANNTKFQIKRGGHSPLCPPLNPLLLTDITSGVTFTHPSNQFEDYLRINPNLVGHKWKDKKKTKSTTTFIILDHENKVTKMNNI